MYLQFRNHDFVVVVPRSVFLLDLDIFRKVIRLIYINFCTWLHAIHPKHFAFRTSHIQCVLYLCLFTALIASFHLKYYIDETMKYCHNHFIYARKRKERIHMKDIYTISNASDSKQFTLFSHSLLYVFFFLSCCYFLRFYAVRVGCTVWHGVPFIRIEIFDCLFEACIGVCKSIAFGYNDNVYEASMHQIATEKIILWYVHIDCTYYYMVGKALILLIFHTFVFVHRHFQHIKTYVVSYLVPLKI